MAIFCTECNYTIFVYKSHTVNNFYINAGWPAHNTHMVLNCSVSVPALSTPTPTTVSIATHACRHTHTPNPTPAYSLHVHTHLILNGADKKLVS